MRKIDKIDLVIFDLDGTLIDSNGSNNELDVCLVHYFNNKISPEEIIEERDNFFKTNKSGDIYLNYCKYLKEKFDSELSPEEILQYRRDKSKEVSRTIKFKPNADRVIKYLKDECKKLGLATVSRRETLDIYENENQFMLEKLNLKDYFDYSLTKDDVVNKKPNPEVYNKMLEHFNVEDKSRCLVVEDSLSGVMSAKNAGLDVVAVYDKYNDKDREKINELATFVVNDFNELQEMLNEEELSPCVFRKRNTDKFLAFIEITNSCNMKCKHCMNWSVKGSKQGFEKSEILKLIDDLHANNTEEIYISGGEPLLYPYIDEVIRHAYDLGIKVTLATNALEIANHIDTIKDCVSLVSISLDGLNETHDNFRGVEGAFDNCVKMFKLLKENNVKTRISAMIWKDNIDQLEDMIKLVKENGVSKMNLAFLIPEGRAKDDESIQLPENTYVELVERVKELRKKYKCETFDIELRRNFPLTEKSCDCPGGGNLLHINVDGKVSPCSWIAKLDKNNEFSAYWPEKSIKECIEKFDNFRKVVAERKEKYSYSGCVALSKIYNGDFMAEDPLNDYFKK